MRATYEDLRRELVNSRHALDEAYRYLTRRARGEAVTARVGDALARANATLARGTGSVRR